MKELTYTIEFLSDWRCGSGLTAGTKSDIQAIKDKDGLPYIPGKTIKGLLKDACMDIFDVQETIVSKTIIDEIFGYETKERTYEGIAFFSDATLKANDRKALLNKKDLIPYLYRITASTKIDEEGLAEAKTLRNEEVCMPLVLEGRIININDGTHRIVLENAFKWLRHIGDHRNRGLGRCSIKLINP